MSHGLTFHNKATIKVQAQIYMGRTLVGACQAGPGETHTLALEAIPYDIFFRDGATGWEIARELNSEATILTLNQHQGHYTVTSGESTQPFSLRQALRSGSERIQQKLFPQNGEPRRKMG
jgi:hypothetical protein